MLRTMVWLPARPRIRSRVSMICLQVETRGQLVENQDFGIVQDGLRQPDALAVAFELGAMAVVVDVSALHRVIDAHRAPPTWSPTA